MGLLWDFQSHWESDSHAPYTECRLVLDECLFLGSTKAAVQMLSEIGVDVLELIVADEQCEFDGRQNLADVCFPVTSLVRTKSVDVIPNPQRRFPCCYTLDAT